MNILGVSWLITSWNVCFSFQETAKLEKGWIFILPWHYHPAPHRGQAKCSSQYTYYSNKIREHLHLYVPEHLRNTYGALSARHKREVDNLHMSGFWFRREIWASGARISPPPPPPPPGLDLGSLLTEPAIFLVAWVWIIALSPWPIF